MSDDFVYMSAAALVSGYRSKRFTPLDVLDATLGRIEALESRLNAWQLVDARAAGRDARASARRWAAGEPAGHLDGVPVAIKDVTETRGWPTLNGSLAISPEGPWPEDAIVVERLRAHGAVIIGKTTTPEFAWKGTTDSRLHGITRNPWNPDWTPCGSSGGSAAAVASGMVAIATGTDSGGSIRGPASFCGVVGFKPSFGRVPVWPASPMMTLEHIGPITRTVRDAALALTVMAGHDPRDSYALTGPAPDVLSGLEGGVRGMRIAWSPDLGFATVDPVIRRIAARAAREVFTALGARLSRIRADIGDPSRMADVLSDSLAAAVTRSLAPRRPDEPVLLAAAGRGNRLSALDLLEAEAGRRDLTCRLEALMSRYDLLVLPTLGTTPFAAERSEPEGWERSQRQSGAGWMATTFPFDLTGQPAISLPCGFTKEGAPVGLQIVGPRGGDALVLRAARAFEEASPVTGRRPPAG